MTLLVLFLKNTRAVALALGVTLLVLTSACSQEHVDSPQEHAQKVQQNRKGAAILAGEKHDVEAALAVVNQASSQGFIKGFRIKNNFILDVQCDADVWNNLSSQDQDVVFQNLLSTWHNIRQSRVPGSSIGLNLIDLAGNNLKSNGMFDQ